MPNSSFSTAVDDQKQLELARALVDQGYLADAVDILGALVLSETSKAEVYYELGCLAAHQGDIDTAIFVFSRALEKNCNFSPARFYLADIFRAQDRFKEALEILTPLLKTSMADMDEFTCMREQIKSLKSNCARYKSSLLQGVLGHIYAKNLNGFKWFESSAEYFEWDEKIKVAQEQIECNLAEKIEIDGYCLLCDRETSFVVSSGLLLREHIHLREGMICAHCGIHNRGRLLGLAINSAVQKIGVESQILLMEATTPLFKILKSRFANLIGSEFINQSLVGGIEVDLNGETVRHENILDLSFENESIDIIAHADLLEHIPDVERALSECHRVLKPGGQLIFSAPFNHNATKSQKCAVISANGEIEHLFPPAYHGSHLVYYNYGWDLLEFCRSAGFVQVYIGVCFDPLQGLVSTGRFGDHYMQPIVITCVR